MKNLEVIVDSSNSLVYPNRKVLGNEFENLQGNIIFKFKNKFIDGTAWLEIKKPDNTTGFLPMEKINEAYILPIKSSLINKKGKLYMQLRITENETTEGIPIFKSNIFYINVEGSLNTEVEIPDEYEDWLTKADRKLNEFDLAIQQIDNLDIDTEKINKTTIFTITKKDGSKKQVEIKDYELTEKDKQELINATTEAIQPQFDEINEEVAQLDRDITNVDNRVTGLQEELQEQEESINHLDDTKADRVEIPDVSEFIKKTVNDLVNYYKKSETYTQAEVNQLIGAIKTVSMKVMPSRPEVGEANIIYLISSAKTEPENIYDEWIYINNKWEIIGSTQVDLSNYYTIEQINTILFDYITSNDLEETLKNYALKSELTSIKGGEVIEIGEYQYTYEGTVLPAIPVEVAKVIYQKDKQGTPLTLHWELYGTENNLKVVSSDLIMGTYSIDVLIHNKYHCAYEWTENSTGNINPSVQTQQEVPTFTNTTLGVIKGSTENGKIGAESDGTASVNGFIQLSNRVTIVEGSYANKQYVQDQISSAITNAIGGEY